MAKTAAKPPATVNRNAKDGRFVTDKYTKHHPATTVTETIKKK
ncbi:MAG TPA: hypothetical protein PLE74_01370 [Candidatus Cloacimonadota bacterium]|nr:hypothetical protein [Candidatus Cloacimonadota bacterium]